MTPREIRSPGDLADVIRRVAEAVRAGDLLPFKPAKPPPLLGIETDIRKLDAEGPWPDYLELHFKDVRTGQRFRLVAETYHGAGGHWELVDAPAT